MADNERLTVDQKVKVVLFYAETKSVVAIQRRFRAHFGTRWAPCKQTVYRLSLGTIFQHMRINSAPDVKCFCNNKNVLCVQSMVWHFVRHHVFLSAAYAALANFSTLSLKRHDFLKKNYWTQKGVFWFSLQFWVNYRYIIINVHMSSCEAPVIVVRFYLKLNFLDRFSKKILKYEIAWQSVFFHADGGTYRQTYDEA